MEDHEVNFAIFLLAAYGLTFAIRAGKINWLISPLLRFDFFRRMFQCPLCLGTEIGFFLYLLLYLRPGITWNFIPNCFVYGLAAGAVCLMIEEWINSISTSIEDDDG